MRKPIEVISYQSSAPDHHHHHTQIVMPISGELTLQVEGQEALIKKGQACLISKEFNHTHYAELNNRCVVINALSSWNHEVASASAFVTLTPIAQRYLEFLAHLDGLEPDHPMLPQAMNMLELMLPLPAESLTHQDRRFIGAKALLEKDIAYPWTMTELAQKIHLSQSQLSVLFKRSLGLTPKQYLLKLRLEKAQYHITTTQWSLEQIAEKVGLTDANALIRLFRQQLQLTPRQYQSQRLNPLKHD
ncbi:AraC family transcriptional regulator [Marinomonas sp.]